MPLRILNPNGDLTNKRHSRSQRADTSLGIEHDRNAARLGRPALFALRYMRIAECRRPGVKRRHPAIRPHGISMGQK
jgi:hypothetical protein